VGEPAYGHVPVMAARVTDLLLPALRPSDAGAADGAGGAPRVMVDATLGRAGHARALLAACPGLSLVGIDADEAAIEHGRALAGEYPGQVQLAHAFYDQIAAIVGDAGYREVQGVLFDLGVSSPQLDDSARGFSYSRDAPLDMRMDLSSGRTAADIVNSYTAAELARVLFEYGEERFARRIADAIVRERARQPVTTTMRLAGIVRDAIPAAARRVGGNPAKRAFQALRIEVNDELGALRRALPDALGLLAPGGRIVVLAYHSLEDRLVKRELAARSADKTPPGLPVRARDVLAGTGPIAGPEFRLLTRGAERPDSDEIAENPRAASARLRAAERIREAALCRGTCEGARIRWASARSGHRATGHAAGRGPFPARNVRPRRDRAGRLRRGLQPRRLRGSPGRKSGPPRERRGDCGSRRPRGRGWRRTARAGPASSLPRLPPRSPRPPPGQRPPGPAPPAPAWRRGRPTGCRSCCWYAACSAGRWSARW
jgi:16S rRNA (cytosine1402-N4)-methyltransferase